MLESYLFCLYTHFLNKITEKNWFVVGYFNPLKAFLYEHLSHREKAPKFFDYPLTITRILLSRRFSQGRSSLRSVKDH